MTGKHSYDDFDKFYLENYQALLRQAYWLTVNYHDAEELVDESFIIYLRKSPQEDIGNPRAYVVKILSNLLKNYARSQRTERFLFLSLDDCPEQASADRLSVPFSELLPDGLLPWERKILILRYEQNLSYQQISELLNLKEVSCRSRLMRAKRHCRELFEKERDNE